MKANVIPMLLTVAVLAAPGLAQTAGEPVPTARPAAELSQVPLDPEVEVAFWDSVKDSDNPMMYLAYLDQFPNGAFRVIARNRLEALWDKATRAFALLEQLGVALDDPAPGWASQPPAQPPAPPVVVTQPPVVVQPAPDTPRKPPSWQLIRNTQNQLRAHGCYKGTVDGVWGPASEAAMKRYNRRAGTTWTEQRPTTKALKSMRTLTNSGIRICK